MHNKDDVAAIATLSYMIPFIKSSVEAILGKKLIAKEEIIEEEKIGVKLSVFTIEGESNSTPLIIATPKNESSMVHFRYKTGKNAHITAIMNYLTSTTGISAAQWDSSFFDDDGFNIKCSLELPLEGLKSYRVNRVDPSKFVTAPAQIVPFNIKEINAAKKLYEMTLRENGIDDLKNDIKLTHSMINVMLSEQERRATPDSPMEFYETDEEIEEHKIVLKCTNEELETRLKTAKAKKALQEEKLETIFDQHNEVKDQIPEPIYTKFKKSQHRFFGKNQLSRSSNEATNLDNNFETTATQALS